MESHFERISDVTRLQVGDLIIIPSEKNKKRKSLHVSVSTYRSMGISIGDTCRSRNPTDQVIKLLATDTGNARALYVSSIFTGYSSSRENNMLRFLGNSISDRPKLPAVESARLHELPFAGTFSKHTQLMYLEKLLKNAKEMLSGKISESMLFCNKGNLSHTEDECVALVYDSPFGHEDFKARSIAVAVPTTSHRHPEKMMTDDKLESFLTESSIFDHAKLNDGKYANWSNCHGELMVTRKFLLALNSRGATFLRPSEVFIRAVLSRVLINAFNEYEKKCEEINLSAKFFLDNLEQDMNGIKEKIKKAKILKEWLEKTATNKDVLKQFKEVMGC